MTDRRSGVRPSFARAISSKDSSMAELVRTVMVRAGGTEPAGASGIMPVDW